MLLAVVLCLGAGFGQAPGQGTHVNQPTPLRVLRISAGPAGAEADGAFVLREERSVFSRVDDREVIVLFQWDGSPGTHKLVAQWRSPDGGLTSTSAVDYVAKDPRFGAYWRLPLSPGMPIGTWSIDVTVDGQPGGRFTFEIRDDKVVTPSVKRPLTQAELYERLNRVFVVIERSTSGGRQLDSFGGFLVGEGRLYTALAALDGAHTLRSVSSDGSRRDLTSVLAWNRRQDWAILEGGSGGEESMPVAAAESVRIGDRFFSMEGGASGGRVLAEGSLTGRGETPSAGKRFIATFVSGAGTPGAPVLNEFGELVGMTGGSTLSGATTRMDLKLRLSSWKLPMPPVAAVYRVDAMIDNVTFWRGFVRISP